MFIAWMIRHLKELFQLHADYTCSTTSSGVMEDQIMAIRALQVGTLRLAVVRAGD